MKPVHVSRLLYLLCCLALAPLRAQQPVPYSTPHAPLLGSAWYPEQWPESRWDADLTLMEQAHMNVVRVGEFAWSSLEPEEGRFDLDWLDRAIALAARHHISVVIGTPTDAPPAWLTTRYPDTLGMNADGRYRAHGGRRQFNYASPRYRELCARIDTELARRFGHNPDVIGWQIGNEYTEESFDPATRALFQQFLRAKYKTLANVNRQWATAYWSETYDSWNEIPMENTGGNPGLLLDHKHFVTATWRDFQRNQIDALRRYIAPSQFVTTNIGGLAWSDNWDHYTITRDLNLASWDEYVGQGHLDVAKEAMLNDFARGWKRQNFWLMETEPGSVNWAPVNNALYRGETRALAWQAVGHGADAILYWQWRSALNGQEQYHGAIVGPDGEPLPIYGEIAQLGQDFARSAAALAGTSPRSQVALLDTYDSRWAIDFQLHTKDYDQQGVLLRFYKPLEQTVQSVDIVEASDDLTGYKLVVAPSLNVISQDLADHLIAYVRRGGHLLLGPRSGMKDEYNSLHPERQPGPLVAALGGRVDQFYALAAPVALEPHGSADTWAETLVRAAPDSRVDLRYGATEGGWLDHQPAMISHPLGAGTISYLGTLPDPTVMASILEGQVRSAGAAGFFPSLPEGIELCRRAGPAGPVYILINHGAQPRVVSLPSAMHDLLSESGDALTSVKLRSQQIAVLVPSSRH